MRHPHLTFVGLALPLALAACGGSWEGIGPDGPAGASGSNVLLAVHIEPSGPNCAAGGSRITAGPDADGDGTLSPAEVRHIQYVCHGTAGSTPAPGTPGAPGVNGLEALVRMTDEPPGATCPFGGKAISAGLDANRNGMLDDAEVSDIGHVCHGHPGLDGADGVDGLDGANGADGADAPDSVWRIAYVGPGSDCADSGLRISWGLDTNGNGVLNDAEIGSAGLVCAGEPDVRLRWTTVTAPAVQAEPDRAYIAAHDSEQVVITLPPNEALAIGDVIRVSGAGQGGWRIAQNAGQSVRVRNIGAPAAGIEWRSTGSQIQFGSIAASADGKTLVASGVMGGSNRTIFTSNDGGATWVAQAHVFSGFALASSADGRRLIAGDPGEGTGGTLRVSTDGGVNWQIVGPTQAWWAVASSADGSRLVAVANGGPIYTSSDFGQTWIERASARSWMSVASSADGMRLVAVEGDIPNDTPGRIHISTDGGQTWTPNGPSGVWTGVAASADGMRLVAIEWQGQIHTSADGGVTWTPRETARPWRRVVSSADGRKLVAMEQLGQIHVSDDAGETWQARTTNNAWDDVAIAADGGRMYATYLPLNPADTASLAASTEWTKLGPDGWISGDAFESITLQYAGSGAFEVIGSAGELQWSGP